jgi:BirA family transcriptional regulator, biotin operon repressor / biotin---[acetyl-CoA-carboxylase] ligase
MRLDQAVLTTGVQLIEYVMVGSTNAEALALTRAGKRGPLWVTAKSQSAGRGRRGRAWVSEPGNLYASLLLSDPSPPDRAAELSFVASLAVLDATARLAPSLSDQLALKWPNDVLIANKKFAGVLIEAEDTSVVIGIGVNCVSHPGEARIPATDLSAMGASVTAESMFEALSSTMMQRLAQWNRGAGFGEIRANWVARAAGLGGAIRVALENGEQSGLFETVDSRGRLVMRLGDGRQQTITAGDVLLVSAHDASRATER